MVLAQNQICRTMEQNKRLIYIYKSPCNGKHQTFGKDAKNILWRKDSIVNKWRWGNWVSTGKLVKLNP